MLQRSSPSPAEPASSRHLFQLAYRVFRLAYSSQSTATGYWASMAEPLMGGDPQILQMAVKAAFFRHHVGRYNGIQSWPAATRRKAINAALRSAQCRRWGYALSPERVEA